MIRDPRPKSALRGAVSICAAALLILFATPRAQADPSGDNSEDPSGNRIWKGEEAPEREELFNRVDEEVSSHEDVFAGSSLTSDRKILEVYVSNPGDPAVTELRGRAGEGFETYVRLVPVPHSMTDLLTAQDQISTAIDSDSPIVGTAPDIEHNSLIVTLDSATPNVPAQLRERRSMPLDSARVASRSPSALTGTLEKLETTIAPTGVDVRLELGSAPSYTATRGNDSSPFSGGAAVRIRSDNGRCSLGFPVTISGVTYEMTAGHCGKSSFTTYAGGKNVGSTANISWPGNTSKYGDWQIIKGASYARYVYSGSLTSSQRLPISRGNLGSRRNGSELCTSGSTTGALCRYAIVRSHSRANIDGYQTAYLTEVMHDPNRDGVGTCSGFQSGDSGGTVYYASASKKGYVEVLGLVSAKTRVASECRSGGYYLTELRGVLMWNSSTHV